MVEGKKGKRNKGYGRGARQRERESKGEGDCVGVCASARGWVGGSCTEGTSHPSLERKKCLECL